MKNFIKNFSQFQRLNESDTPFDGENHPDNFVIDDRLKGEEDLFSDEEDFRDLLDGVTDRMYENGMNGTLGSSGSTGATFKMIDENSAEVTVIIHDGEEIFKFILREEPNNSVTYEVENRDVYGPYKHFYVLTDSMSQYILNVVPGGKDYINKYDEDLGADFN